MHITKSQLFGSEVDIKHTKTVKFWEANMSSGSKIFDEVHSFILRYLKFWLQSYGQTYTTMSIISCLHKLIFVLCELIKLMTNWYFLVLPKT